MQNLTFFDSINERRINKFWAVFYEFFNLRFYVFCKFAALQLSAQMLRDAKTLLQVIKVSINQKEAKLAQIRVAFLLKASVQEQRLVALQFEPKLQSILAANLMQSKLESDTRFEESLLAAKSARTKALKHQSIAQLALRCRQDWFALLFGCAIVALATKQSAKHVHLFRSYVTLFCNSLRLCFDALWLVKRSQREESRNRKWPAKARKQFAFVVCASHLNLHLHLRCFREDSPQSSAESGAKKTHFGFVVELQFW